MKWEKRGHIFAPDGSRGWARTNASFPTVELLDEDVLRVYFSALDEHNFGRTGYVDLDAGDPQRIVGESADPILDVGDVGTFDDCGANAFSIVTGDTKKYLYYQGWQRTERAPYLIFSGLAIDHGNGAGFEKNSKTPILDRTETDPYIRGAPYVVREPDGFRMWYVSSRRWVTDEHGLHYDVGIRHARSAEGIDWEVDPGLCVSVESADEYAVGRPAVLVDAGIYRMWYSVRSFSQPYRLGYAESTDGREWIRKDADVGIGRATEGWDSQMICYADVVRIKDRLLMFYNGNQHGATGFGYAEAVAD